MTESIKREAESVKWQRELVTAAWWFDAHPSGRKQRGENLFEKKKGGKRHGVQCAWWWYCNLFSVSFRFSSKQTIFNHEAEISKTIFRRWKKWNHFKQTQLHHCASVFHTDIRHFTDENKETLLIFEQTHTNQSNYLFYKLTSMLQTQNSVNMPRKYVLVVTSLREIINRHKYSITPSFLFPMHRSSIQSLWFYKVICGWLVSYICVRESLTQEESTLSQGISSCTHCRKKLIKHTRAHIRESCADWTLVLHAFDLNFSSPSKHAHF